MAVEVTVLVCTALSVEMKAVVSRVRDPKPTMAGPVLCEVGQFEASNGTRWRVVAAELGPGTVDTAAAVVATTTKFHPEIVMFVGIAGALRDDVSTGDVVVGSTVCWTERGKASEAGYLHRAQAVSLSYPLSQLARRVAREGTWTDRLLVPHAAMKAIVGQIASGEKVVADTLYREELRRAFSDAVAIENEGFGLARAAEVYTDAETCVIRGISDSADPGKDDRAQPEAADAAAAFCFELLDAYSGVLASTTSARPPAGSAANLLSERWRADDSGHSAPAALARPGPRVAGSMPRVWNVPARNPGFTGRDALLVAVRERLLAGDAAVVQALRGMGGVGKTQLAMEYAHRFVGAYDLAWWIDAERAGLIGDQFAALGAALGCVGPGATAELVRQVVLGELRERGRYLLIFDNAERPGDVAGWLPGGGGHALITTRERGWDEIAAPVEVDVLARPESIAILRNRVAGLSEADADLLATELGDLPLALAQAAAFMAGTGTSAASYRDLLRTRAAEVMGQSPPSSYPRSLAAATGLVIDRLAADDPAAAELAVLCAFFAPEPIPGDLFTTTTELPAALAGRAADPLAWRQTLARLTGQALARVDQRGVQVHRLTQAILRDRLTPGQAAATRNRAEAILTAGNPRDAGNPATWTRWAQMLPHLLTASLADTGNADLRSMACGACWYLLARGQARAAHDLAARLRQAWRDQLGDDDQHTLAATRYLAWALGSLGRYAQGRDLDQDTLSRYRRVLGDDHPDTLTTANGLAVVLRQLNDHQAARDLHQDTLDRRRRVLGDDHPDTLTSTNGLATDLYALGHHQTARDLFQDALDRRRRVLGDNHPDTLTSANGLADALHALGHHQAARDLHQDALDRRRRVLGDNHPDTLRSFSNLAIDLRALSEPEDH